MGGTPVLKSIRVVLVDMLRGLTIFVMIFANFGFLNAPWYMKHYDWRAFTGATYVDYIFSMFMILVGISIPLAFRKYEDNLRGNWKLIRHIFVRSASLLFIGLLYINTPDVEKMGVFGSLAPLCGWTGLSVVDASAAVWRLIVTTGVILLFNQIVIDDYRWRRVSLLLKVVGVGILACYMSVFEPAAVQTLTAEEQSANFLVRGFNSVFLDRGNWFRGGWWEIIGLIGWAYLAGGLLYMVVRKTPELIYLALTFLLLFAVCGAYSRFAGVPFLDNYNGLLSKHTIVVMLGVGLGAMMLRAQGSHKAIYGMLLRFAFICALICAIITPVFGLENGSPEQQADGVHKFLFSLNKNNCSLGWIFSTGVFCALLWMLFYYPCDVKKSRNFIVRFFASLGSVPLTAYIFQFWFFAFFNCTGLLVFRWNEKYCNAWTSALISFAVTLLICGAAVLCRKYKFSLKL